MIDLIAAEFLKLRTTRTFWWVSGLAIGLPVLIVVISLATTDYGHKNRDDVLSLLSIAGITGLMMIVLGVVNAGGEYKHGTITSTFLTAPDRTRVILAKGIAHLVAGLCVGIVGTAIIFAIIIPWLSGDGHSLHSFGIDSGDLVRIAAGSVAYVGISAALGVGLGSLITNQTVAVVGVLIVSFAIDPIAAGLVHAYGKFSLQGLGQTLSGSPTSTIHYAIFPVVAAGLIYLGYALALLAVSSVVTTRRDVA